MYLYPKSVKINSNRQISSQSQFQFQYKVVIFLAIFVWYTLTFKKFQWRSLTCVKLNLFFKTFCVYSALVPSFSSPFFVLAHYWFFFWLNIGRSLFTFFDFEKSTQHSYEKHQVFYFILFLCVFAGDVYFDRYFITFSTLIYYFSTEITIQKRSESCFCEYYKKW